MDQDLKDTIKKLEEAKSKQEKIERIIILLSGLLIVIIFSIIGINVYSGKEETISEPEINIVAKQKEIEKSPPLVEKPAQEKEKKEIKAVQPEKSAEKTEKTKTEQKIVKAVPEAEKKIKKKEKAQPKAQPKKKVAKNPFPSGYYIQAGAFSTKKKAEKLLKKLNLQNAKIRKEGELYKVLIGNFKNRKEAYRFMKEKNIKGFVRKI
ncbi:SPOR domain-containing protein [Persephonella sp.]